MTILNDIDSWFVDRVSENVESYPECKNWEVRLQFLCLKSKPKKIPVELFKKADSRIRWKELFGLSSIDGRRRIKFEQLDFNRSNLALQRAWPKEINTLLLQELRTLNSERLKDKFTNMFLELLEESLEKKGSYHEGQWNGK